VNQLVVMVKMQNQQYKEIHHLLIHLKQKMEDQLMPSLYLLGLNVKIMVDHGQMSGIYLKQIRIHQEILLYISIKVDVIFMHALLTRHIPTITYTSIPVLD